MSFSLRNPSILAFIILDHNVTIFDRFEISLYYSQPSCSIRTLCVLSINFVTNEDVRIQLFLFKTSEEKISVFAMAVVVCIDLIIILFALQVHSSVRPSACLSVRSYIRFVIESSNFSSQRFGNLISYDLLICFHLLGIEASPLCFQLLLFFFWKMRWKVQFGIFLFGSFRKDIVVAFLPLNYMDKVQRAPLQFPGISLDGR